MRRATFILPLAAMSELAADVISHRQTAHSRRVNRKALPDHALASCSSNSGKAIMTETASIDLRQFVRDIPDFPKPGILFKDITPLLANPNAFRASIDQLANHYQEEAIDVVVAAEARGFVFAAPLALALNVSFVPIRKPGKLPFDRHSFEYDLEYGSDTLEIHVDGVEPGQRVLVVDDLLATGGTVDACCRLLEKCGANIMGCAFVIELLGLGGRAKIGDYDIYSLIQYGDA